LNVHEAARLLGVHVETIRRLARNGEIPAFKVGRGWRIRMESLTGAARYVPGTLLVRFFDSKMLLKALDAKNL
jgi:excisionase family DNA binding protein